MVRDKWKENTMHGKFPNYLDNDHVDVELSFEWMKHTGLKGETEGLITAAQDQAVNIRYYSKHIIKQGTTDRCRMCHTQPETVEHIISGCQTLAADQYLNRHNQVAAQLHLDICRHYGIKVEAECWYQHKTWMSDGEWEGNYHVGLPHHHWQTCPLQQTRHSHTGEEVW